MHYADFSCEVQIFLYFILYLLQKLFIIDIIFTHKMNPEEKKSTLIWGIAGGIFSLFGVLLLSYTGYILFSKSESQKISELLPTQDLEFVLFSAHSANHKSSEKEFFTQLFSPLFSGNKEEVVAVYSNDEVIVISEFNAGEKKENSENSSNTQYCENIQGYNFCAQPKHSTRVVSLIDSIKKNAPALQKDDYFVAAQKQLSPENNNPEFYFFGKTPFVKNLIWEHTQHFLDDDIKEGIFDTLEIIQEKSPYITGNIHNQNFTLLFAKSDKTTIFSNIISEYDISEYFIHPSVDRYLLVKKPKVLWDSLFLSLGAKNMSTEFLTKKAVSHSFSTFFTGVSQQGEVSLQFQKDILPLFEGDILWAQSPTGNAILYSLPKKTITSQVFEKFSQTTEKIAQWSLPVKVGHTFKDGTTVYEVFPNEENISIERDDDENGTKTVFTNTQAQKTLGVVQRDTFLMVANDTNFLDHFWNLQGEKSAFSFQNAKNDEYFFSLGFQKRETEKSPILSAEIYGKELPESFQISGKIQWNADFFTEGAEEIREQKNSPEISDISEEEEKTGEGEAESESE